MNCEVKCLGIGGGKVSNSDHVQTILSFIEKNRPEHVIVHIGGNDLDIFGASEDTVEELGLRLILLSQTLTTRFEIKSVTICQLLPRESTRVIASNVYNDLVIKTNRFLKAQIKDQPHCRYWKITGVKNSDRNNYVDGVHFNYDVGMPKYFRNIRGSIIQAMK
ncbi:Hypothetical predicted protein [Mytilus galloprovincialis]|uniref:SGNH hydrolase-type esterase domain-containing protein n=1 Tax=Mytilus galloprovincialis TaxID=29158 RepID=A0A8B6HK74_MYTGA|nr:Hypothetical predicted protein [Mytilus galloprovincialis]